MSNANGKKSIQYVSRNQKNPEVEVFERCESHSKGFMVWAGVSFNGKTRIHFIEPGAKINSNYYISNVLKPFLRYDALRLYPKSDYVFHQDSAPSHTSKATLEFMEGKMKFVKPEEWMPKSPDAAPMDYFVWGWLKKKLSTMKVNDMAGLKRAIKGAWKKLPQDMVNRALESWSSRCLKIYKAKGQHIE